MKSQPINRYKWWKKEYFGLLSLALIVSVFSFPEIDLSYSIGIDPSLKWLFNYLFTNNLSLGREIIFPHGPLAFFMYPLAENFVLSVIITALLQIAFVMQLFMLTPGKSIGTRILTATLAWFVFSISNFNQLILSNILIGYLLFLKSRISAAKYWGLLLTAFAFYVKAYVAILSGTLTFSFLTIIFFREKQYRQTLIDAILWVSFMLIFWTLLYGQINGFPNYCLGMFHLAGDNSSAAAYFPVNNWPFIVPLLIVAIILPFLQKGSEGKTFGLLFVLSFFAAWKYGMAREDFFHVRAFLFFTVISMMLFLIFNYKKTLINSSILIVVTVLFSFNLKNIENTQPLSIHYSGIQHFFQFITSYPKIIETSRVQNLKNIESNRLPEPIRQKIGNATTDIYPWDYTIIAANQLNWEPRPVIQSYASYTSWLDRKNANHLSKNTPQYFVFGTNNITADLNGYKLESIDNRYLLNDEPQTLIELIQNYKTAYADRNFLVYQKRGEPLAVSSTQSEALEGNWNQWIAVPNLTDKLTRLRLNVSDSFSGKIKSFLYKGELFFMYFKTTDGDILKYRIVPKNAKDGVWISPFYTSGGDDVAPKKVTEIMVTCSNINNVKSSFSYEWEYFDFSQHELNDFFGKDSISEPKIFINTNFPFETSAPNWNNIDQQKIITDRESLQKTYLIEPQSFSPSFQYEADSLELNSIRIKVCCWVKTERNAHSNLVIESEYISGEKNWHGVEINRQLADEKEFNPIISYLDLDSPVKKISIYVWNNGTKPVLFSSMNVKILAEPLIR